MKNYENGLAAVLAPARDQRKETEEVRRTSPPEEMEGGRRKQKERAEGRSGAPGLPSDHALPPAGIQD